MLGSTFNLKRRLVSFKHRRMMDRTKVIIASIFILVVVIALIVIVTSKDRKQVQDVNQEDIVQKFNITGDVLELKSDTFADALKSSEYVLVEFYSPMCSHCLEFTPEYEKAAKTLASEGSHVLFTKVDIESAKELRGELEGKAYPVVKLYKNGVGLVTIDSTTTAQDLIRWLYKKISSPTRIISNIDEAETILGENNIIVFGFFTDFDSVDADTFKETAALTEEFHFAITNNSEVFDQYNVSKNSVYLFKRDDKESILMEDTISVYNIQRFIKNHAHPLICDYDNETKSLIFGGDFNLQIWFVMSKSLGDYDKFMPAIRSVANSLRYQMFFVTIDTTNPKYRRLLREFDIEVTGSSRARMFITKLNEDYKTYAADEDLEPTEENIRKFIDDFYKNKIIPVIPN